MGKLRPLRPAWMLEVTASGRGGRGWKVPPVRGRARPHGAEERIDALVKLKGLLDSGVLTPRQFAGERDRLLGS